MKREDYFIHNKEWEDLSILSEITELKFLKGVFSFPSDSVISINRNRDCRLSAVLKGGKTHISEINMGKEWNLGQLVESETIIGTSNGVFEVIIGDAFLYHTKPIISLEEKGLINSYSGSLKVGGVQIRKTNLPEDFEPSFIREWYIGAHNNLYFPRCTTRSSSEGGKRSRQYIDPEIELDFNLENSRSVGRDWMIVDMTNYKFVISEVPIGYAPNSCKALVFEYQKGLGGIPNDDDRYKIAQIAGFLLGTQLSKLGSSYYDETDNISGSIFENPWGYNIPDRYESLALPPVKYADYFNPCHTEMIFSSLIPLYLKQEGKYCLNGTLNKYWVARYSLLGTNLPILSSAIEGMVENVFKQYKQAYTYFKSKEFKTLIEDEIESIKTKLAGHKYSDMLLNKINTLNNFGGGEKLRIMFDLIGLPVGDVENKAMKSRNAMAHTTSSGEMDKVDMERIIKHSHAYVVLVNRIILKILGYAGNYIDYHTLGFPERNINEPIPN